MANQKQVKILLQGAEIWNKWRNKNPDISIDLSGANLMNAYLRSFELSYADLNGADLSGAKLMDANLGGRS